MSLTLSARAARSRAARLAAARRQQAVVLARRAERSEPQPQQRPA